MARPTYVTKLSLLVCSVLIASESAFAHHSFAMFDSQKNDVYPAVVSTWEFANPHTYLWVYITDKSGRPQLWGLEGPATALILRTGMSKTTFKPGDKVTVELHPLRDGRLGGQLVAVTNAEGKSMRLGTVISGPNLGPNGPSNGEQLEHLK